MNLATQSLKFTSIQAARLWQQLEKAENPHEIDDLVSSIWQVQNEQEATIDIYVALAHQIDAEVIAIKARMEYLIDVHKTAINKLETWHSSLDKTILNLNEQGLISNEVAGNNHRITVKENPPSCELLVDPEQLPEKYQRQQVKVSADKKAIIAAWKKGIPVEGAKVYRNRKVVYGLSKNSNFQSL
jgi:hypothetical protein